MKRPRAHWSRAIIVCGKCSKKIGGGFGARGRLPLAKALRRDLGLKKGRKAALGIVESKCLGICPRRAVTVVDAALPGEWLLIRERTPLAEVETALGLSFPPE